MAKVARNALTEKKAANVVILDVRGLSAVTDFYIIGMGNSAPHLKALLNSLDDHLKKIGIAPFRVAGNPESEWIVADYIDIVVHIFSAEARNYYNLERLWCDAPRVP